MAQQRGKLRSMQARTGNKIVIDLYASNPGGLMLKPDVLGGSFDAAVALCLSALLNDWKLKINYDGDLNVTSVLYDAEQQ